MKMRKCGECDTYTLKTECPKCGADTITPHPPSFSLSDKHGKFRRAAKIKMKESKKEI